MVNLSVQEEKWHNVNESACVAIFYYALANVEKIRRKTYTYKLFSSGSCLETNILITQ
jgi:hypothetical protein